MRPCLAGGGTARLEVTLHLHRRLSGARDDAPVRIRAEALGPGRPARDLVVSPQHRIWLPEIDDLGPARALTCLPRVGLMRGLREIAYVNLVLARHAVILAKGQACESLWPGPVAMAAVPQGAAARIRRVMGPAPAPARALIGVGTARRLLAEAAASAA